MATTGKGSFSLLLGTLFRISINIGIIGHLSKLTFVNGSHDNECSFGEEREHLVSTI